MDMTIRVGIIGYGKMGKIRHEAIRDAGGAEVVAVSETYLKETTANLPNIQPDEMIGDSSIDAIVICTPNHLNAPLTLRSLNAGKHVFCEKPPSFNAADMEKVREAEHSSGGKKLMYGFNHRHHDSVIRMKELTDQGVFGKILWMRGRYGKSVTDDYFKQWRAKRDLAGGGILIDQGIHMLDLFMYLGGDFDVVKAEISNLYWKLEVEDNAFVILKNSGSGLVASLHSTMSQWRHLFSLEVFLEKGYMVLNGLLTASKSYGEEVLSIAKNRSAAPAASWEDETRTPYLIDNSWRYEMEHFFNAIRTGEPVRIGNSSDALSLMRIIDEIYKNRDF
jgi:1,5-anhydro-D-fructose reductase (1,5-anhydro-D-mannitol-forming)